MTSKSILWALLAVAALTIFATPAWATDQVAAPEAIEDSATDALAPTMSTPNCAGTPTVLGGTGLGESEKAGPVLSNYCGACSNDPCKGRQRGSWCAPNKWCIPEEVTLCPGTTDWDCSCASSY
jgi:hypothetical protein